MAPSSFTSKRFFFVMSNFSSNSWSCLAKITFVVLLIASNNLSLTCLGSQLSRRKLTTKQKVLEVLLFVLKSKVIVQVIQASNSGVTYFEKHFFVICNMISLVMTSWNGKTQQLSHFHVNHLTQIFIAIFKDIKPLTHINTKSFLNASWLASCFPYGWEKPKYLEILPCYFGPFLFCKLGFRMWQWSLNLHLLGSQFK